MIQDKLVKKTVYISLFAQLLTTLISLHGLKYSLNEKDKVLKEILILEAFVQFIEAMFYVWVIFALKDLKLMTSRRYIDWFITTPTMLFTTIIFMKYLEHKETNKETITIQSFVSNETDYNNTKEILFYNVLMLLFGFLGEINVLQTKTSVLLGFIFFGLSFKIIYEKYASKTEIGTNLYIFLIIVWSLYGVAALMNLRMKNTMYNLLDIVSKNFYGLYIYYYITQVGILDS
jgi:hypothetical protein